MLPKDLRHEKIRQAVFSAHFRSLPTPILGRFAQTQPDRSRFRALMWEFRRDPDDLTPSKRKALEGVFAEIPILQQLYEVRLEFKRIFDTAPDPATAERALAELRERAHALGLDFDTHTDPLMLPRARPLPGRPSHKGSLSLQ